MTRSLATTADQTDTSAAECAGALYRVLSLDGGGAKGFYTLGVLRELEAMVGCPLHEHFNLIFGTSTGAIIAALLALGNNVDTVHRLYKSHVPTVMRARSRAGKSAALAQLASESFGNLQFSDVKTGVGIVATRWVSERPMIFKADPTQSHGRTATFVPGFGVCLSDAIQASCSAFPFFNRKTITTAAGDRVELIDGGYCANNPTLYALADAVVALRNPPSQVRVINVGVGEYPAPKPRTLAMWFASKLLTAQLLQKTLEINTQSMEQLRSLLFRDVRTIRISDAFTQPEMATDLMEHDLTKLNMIHQRGAESFGARESEIRELML